MQKRSCERFSVPGATLCYRKRRRFFDRGGFGDGFYPVLDISRGGVKFLCNHRVVPGTRIALKLDIPGAQEALEILGTIRWANRNPEKSYRFQVGVAFTPYGGGKGENPPEVLEKIRQIEQAHVN